MLLQGNPVQAGAGEGRHLRARIGKRLKHYGKLSEREVFRGQSVSAKLLREVERP